MHRHDDVDDDDDGGTTLCDARLVVLTGSTARHAVSCTVFLVSKVALLIGVEAVPMSRRVCLWEFRTGRTCLLLLDELGCRKVGH